MSALLLVGLLLREVVVSDVPPRPVEVARCGADEQCVLTTFAGCCGGNCCLRQPYAVTEAELTRATRSCAAVDCRAHDCARQRWACAPVDPVSAFVARCVAGRCVAVRIAPPSAAQCHSAADCQVVSAEPLDSACASSPCGCCTQLRVVPRAAVRSPRPGAEPVPPSPPPKFGLSVAPPPGCAPCPAAAPVRATCVAGRCEAAPVARPLPPG